MLTKGTKMTKMEKFAKNGFKKARSCQNGYNQSNL